VNAILFVVPIGVVTPMFLIPVVAVLATFKVAVMVVELTTVKVPVATVTPVPSPVSAVAPVRLVPVSVTGTLVVPLVGCVAVFGVIEASVGPCTMNVAVLLVPFDVVTTATFLDPVEAVLVMLRVAVIVVGLTTLKVPEATVTPVPSPVSPVAPAKLVPLRVTGTLVPRTPALGVIEASVGLTTVNVAAVLVPFDVVTTATFLDPAVAVLAMLSVAVIVVELTTLKVPVATVTPVPSPVSPVAPAKLVPVRVTGTLVPLRPALGVIEVSVGCTTVNVTVLVVPIGVVTLKFLAPSEVAAVMLNAAVIVVGLTTVKLVTRMLG
jgi:hypothetical protein